MPIINMVYKNKIPMLEKSLDLTALSAAEIQAQWWYLWWKNWASDYSLSSNWLTHNWTHNSSYWVWYNFSWNPKKITLNATYSISSTNQYTWFGRICLWSNEWFDNYNSWDVLNAVYKWWNLDNNVYVRLSNYGNLITDTWYSWTWTFYCKFVIDLENKTIEYSTTSPRTYSKSATLTDAQITAISSYKYLIFGWTLYDTPWSVLKNCSLKVEF